MTDLEPLGRAETAPDPVLALVAELECSRSSPTEDELVERAERLQVDGAMSLCVERGDERSALSLRACRALVESHPDLDPDDDELIALYMAAVHAKEQRRGGPRASTDPAGRAC